MWARRETPGVAWALGHGLKLHLTFSGTTEATTRRTHRPLPALETTSSQAPPALSARVLFLEGFLLFVPCLRLLPSEAHARRAVHVLSGMLHITAPRPPRMNLLEVLASEKHV